MVRTLPLIELGTQMNSLSGTAHQRDKGRVQDAFRMAQ